MPEYMDISPDDPRIAAALNCHHAATALIRRHVLPEDREWKMYIAWANSICPDRHKINPTRFGVN
jgi:hypothetical protein